MRTTEEPRRDRSTQRWVTPAVAVTIGVVYLVAGTLGGDTGFAVFGFALMLGIAVVLLLGGRFSETIAGLLDRRDERINALDGRATSFAGMAVMVAVLIGFVVEIAQGADGAPSLLDARRGRGRRVRNRHGGTPLPPLNRPVAGRPLATSGTVRPPATPWPTRRATSRMW